MVEEMFDLCLRVLPDSILCLHKFYIKAGTVSYYLS